MKQSQKLYNHSQLLIPGGVNSPVRAFRSVGGTPLFIKRGRGAQVWDADGNLWVRTSKNVNGGPVYDVINGKGELIDRVQLPAYRFLPHDWLTFVLPWRSKHYARRVLDALRTSEVQAVFAQAGFLTS